MSIATTTQAQVIDSFGGTDVFRANDRPLVAPGAGQVQVKVTAAGVNPVDLTTRQGKNIHGDAARFPMGDRLGCRRHRRAGRRQGGGVAGR